METVWTPVGSEGEVYEGRDRTTGQLRWNGSRVDLVFGSNSELRAIAEYWASADAKEAFCASFVATWAKVMNLDRFDLSPYSSLGGPDARSML